MTSSTELTAEAEARHADLVTAVNEWIQDYQIASEAVRSNNELHIWRQHVRTVDALAMAWHRALKAQKEGVSDNG